ncbi:ARID DNA-binding domain-containing protein [Tanacetum coccineum]
MKKPEAPKKEKTPPASESIKSGGGKQKKKESYMRQCRLQKRHNVLSFWPWATPSLLSRSLRADVYGSLFQQSERRSVPGHKSYVSECPLAIDVQAILDDIPGKVLPVVAHVAENLERGYDKQTCHRLRERCDKVNTTKLNIKLNHKKLMLGDSSNSRSAESTLKDRDLTSRAVMFVTCLTDSKTLEDHGDDTAITFRHGDEATRARILKNKESVKCFKCQGSGHFANACPQDDTKTTQKQEKVTTAAAPSLPEPKDTINEQFEGDFEGLARLLGLERSDGLDIRRCYLDTGPLDGQWLRRERNSQAFRIPTEEEGKYDATAQQDEEDMARIKCYICQRMGHFDSECPSKDQRPTDGASTSRQQGEKDTHSSSGFSSFYQLRLVYAGRELQGSHTLAYYYVENGSILRRLNDSRMRGILQIIYVIIASTGKLMHLRVDRLCTINEVKVMIQDHEGIPAQLQTLFLPQKRLQDGSTLVDNYIHDQTFIYLVQTSG